MPVDATGHKNYRLGPLKGFLEGAWSKLPTEMLVKGIKPVELCEFNSHNTLNTIPAVNSLFVTSEFSTQKSEYVSNLSFNSRSIFMQLSNNLLGRGRKKCCFTASWLSFTF